MTTDQFRELERRYVRRHDGHWALRKAFTTHVLPAPQSDVVLPSPSPTRLGLLRSRVARLRQHVSPRTMGRLRTCSRPGEPYPREPRSRTCQDVPATAGGVTHRERECVCVSERDRDRHTPPHADGHTAATHTYTYIQYKHTHTHTHTRVPSSHRHAHTYATHARRHRRTRTHTDAYMHVHHSHTHTTPYHIHMHTHTPHTHT
jgi:hypothetical protein